MCYTMYMNTEVRYNNEKLRYFRLENSGDCNRFHVQTSLSWAHEPNSYPEMVRRWGLFETVLVSASTHNAREKWYWNLTHDETKDKLLKWRKKCDGEGLVNKASISMGVGR